jgi:RNase P subunit RPR2
METKMNKKDIIKLIETIDPRASCKEGHHPLIYQTSEYVDGEKHLYLNCYACGMKIEIPKELR